MEINERIKSNVTGRTYIVTWVSDIVTQAEVGFARTDSEGESFLLKGYLMPGMLYLKKEKHSQLLQLSETEEQILNMQHVVSYTVLY